MDDQVTARAIAYAAVQVRRFPPQFSRLTGYVYEASFRSH